jgi:hypothetical protein
MEYTEAPMEPMFGMGFNPPSSFMMDREPFPSQEALIELKTNDEDMEMDQDTQLQAIIGRDSGLF